MEMVISRRVRHRRGNTVPDTRTREIPLVTESAALRSLSSPSHTLHHRYPQPTSLLSGSGNSMHVIPSAFGTALLLRATAREETVEDRSRNHYRCIVRKIIASHEAISNFSLHPRLLRMEYQRNRSARLVSGILLPGRGELFLSSLESNAWRFFFLFFFRGFRARLRSKDCLRVWKGEFFRENKIVGCIDVRALRNRAEKLFDDGNGNNEE